MSCNSCNVSSSYKVSNTSLRNHELMFTPGQVSLHFHVLYFRKLFNISIFFFYFHTIIMGVVGVLARTFTGMFLGVFFLSRTDRNLMIQGFHNSDRGYASYIGYLHVVAMHRNPVRVVFCQILLDLVYQQHVIVKKGRLIFLSEI